MKRITLVTLGLSFAACTSSPSSSTTSPATAADYEDTAQTIASATVTGGNGGIGFGDVLVFSDAVSIARGHLPLGFLHEGDGHFRGSRMGVGHDFTVACKDAAGMAQTACNDKTDSATVTVKLTGSLQTPSFSSSIDREGNFTLTGLQGATATFNGDSSFSLDMTLMSGPFRRLEGSWAFTALSENACKVELSLRYQFASTLIQKMAGPAFQDIMDTFVDAFVRRADEKFGST